VAICAYKVTAPSVSSELNSDEINRFFNYYFYDTDAALGCIMHHQSRQYANVSLKASRGLLV